MKKQPLHNTIENRRARFDFEIERTLVAGISLNGAETKSLRYKHATLNGSYVQLRPDGAWLINMQVTPLVTNAAHMPESTRQRDRRLLLKHSEIEALQTDKQQGRHIVPTRLFTDGRFIKIELGIGKSKKKYDKRQTIKQRDTERLERTRLKR